MDPNLLTDLRNLIAVWTIVGYITAVYLLVQLGCLIKPTTRRDD